MQKVEQVKPNLEVVADYDQPVSAEKIKEILSGYMAFVRKHEGLVFSYRDKEIEICAKNITYLGNPWPIFKKRIQIPARWKRALHMANTLLLGIYHYEGNILFVIFDTENYRHNTANNSSAHVSTIDLKKGFEYGVFEKIDNRNNKITIIRQDKFKDFLDSFVENRHIGQAKEISLIEHFSVGLEKKWDGKTCYKEMVSKEYSNALQPEWPGFYLEYSCKNYVEEDPERKKICTFVSHKKKGQLDFDLDFHGDYLGDLKASSITSGGVLGNDKESFENALSKHGKFWYVVISHATNHDKNHEYEVTKYWNGLLNKRGENKDLMSYAAKMKNSVELKEVLILEINKDNIKYIENFAQGRNSNNHGRNPKIKISKKNINNFLLFKKEL